MILNRLHKKGLPPQPAPQKQSKRVLPPLKPTASVVDRFTKSGPGLLPIQWERSGEPIVSPTRNKALADSDGTYNPSAVVDPDTGDIHILYRATCKPQVRDLKTITFKVAREIYRIAKKVPGVYALKKRLMDTPGKPAVFHSRAINAVGHAVTRDGKTIIERSCMITPDCEQLESYPNGFEDPRVSRIGDTYYVVCNGVNSAERKNLPVDQPIRGAYITLFTTTDFKETQFHGTIGPDTYDKNALFLPAKVKAPNGDSSFMLLHRMFPNIQYVLMKDPLALKDPETRKRFWDKELCKEELSQKTLLSPQFEWEDYVGACSVPIKTPAGWLMIYHAADKQNHYRAGAALLDLEKPWIVKSRSPLPLLEATREESRQFGKSIVFPSGAVVKDQKLLVYYGAGDREVRLAQCNLNELLDCLTQYDALGNLK